MNQMIHSHTIYPVDKERPRDAKVFYRELMKNHDGKNTSCLLQRSGIHLRPFPVWCKNPRKVGGI